MFKPIASCERGLTIHEYNETTPGNVSVSLMKHSQNNVLDYNFREDSCETIWTLGSQQKLQALSRNVT